MIGRYISSDIKTFKEAVYQENLGAYVIERIDAYFYFVERPNEQFWLRWIMLQ